MEFFTKLLSEALAMPGHIHGFVELKRDGWKYLLKVDPFVDASFKYLFFGMKKGSEFGPLPHNEGFPDDLSAGALVSVLPIPNEPPFLREGLSLEEEFEDYLQESTTQRMCHVSFKELRRFDWDSPLSDQPFVDLDNTGNKRDETVLRWFRLVDEKGQELEKNLGYYIFNSKGQISEKGKENLLKGKTVELEGVDAHLEVKTWREVLPERWFRLLDLIEEISEIPDIRFVFYWEH